MKLKAKVYWLVSQKDIIWLRGKFIRLVLEILTFGGASFSQ